MHFRHTKVDPWGIQPQTESPLIEYQHHRTCDFKKRDPQEQHCFIRKDEDFQSKNDTLAAGFSHFGRMKFRAVQGRGAINGVLSQMLEIIRHIIFKNISNLLTLFST